MATNDMWVNRRGGGVQVLPKTGALYGNGMRLIGGLKHYKGYMGADDLKWLGYGAL